MAKGKGKGKGKGKAIVIEGLRHSYGRREVLRGLDIDVADGELVGMIGPNGSGKTTFLNCLSGALRPVAGRVIVGGMDVATADSRALARTVGIVPQATAMTFEFTVEEVVLMGRYPHIERFRFEDSRDLEVAEEAMASTGVRTLRDRPVTELSGGERQRVVIARALAQEPSILLLDEPTSHLDIRHQLEVLDLVRGLNEERGLTVVAVFHDLNLAARYCGRLLLLRDGAVMADGRPEEVLTGENMVEGFGVTVDLGRSREGRVVVEVGGLAKK